MHSNSHEQEYFIYTAQISLWVIDDGIISLLGKQPVMWFVNPFKSADSSQQLSDHTFNLCISLYFCLPLFVCCSLSVFLSLFPSVSLSKEMHLHVILTCQTVITSSVSFWLPWLILPVHKLFVRYSALLWLLVFSFQCFFQIGFFALWYNFVYFEIWKSVLLRVWSRCVWVEAASFTTSWYRRPFLGLISSVWRALGWI